MSDSLNNDVFDRAQAVLSNDWLRKSNKDVTEILEDIEKIGVTEIRFQQGGHVVYGSLDQLNRVRDHLLGKVGSPSSTGISRGKAEQTRCDDDDSRTRDVKSSSKNSSETNIEPETDSSTGIANEGIYTDYASFEIEDMNGCGTKDLMVDRDIWEFIEHKKGKDVKQLASVFEATITKVEDDSGVLRLILKSKFCEARSEDLDILLENLGALYEQTYARCVTETAQIRLSDEQSKRTLDYISKSFPNILAKKCIYNDDFLFIGSRHEVREARKQFQILAHQLPCGNLRRAMDERELMFHSMNPKYNQVFGQNVNNIDDFDECCYDSDSPDEINEPCYPDFASKDPSKDPAASKQDENESILIADDDKEDIGDLPNPNDCCEADKKDDADDDKHDDLNKDQEKNDSEPVANASSSVLPDESLPDESLPGTEIEVAPNDKHAGDELAPETAENLKTEDASAPVENLAVEELPVALEENQKIGQAAKSDVDPVKPLLPADCNEAQKPDTRSAECSGSSKPTKTGKKSKKNACYELPKVTIVKPQFPDTNEPSLCYDKPAPSSTGKVDADGGGEAGCMLKNPTSIASKTSEKQVQPLLSKEERDLKKLFHDQRKVLKKKPYDSPSSSDSEDNAKGGKKPQTAISQETTSFTKSEESELKGNENIEALIEELMLKEDAVSQAKLQKLLDKVAKSEDKETTKTSAAGISKIRPFAQNTQDISKSIPSAALECKKIVGLQPPDGTIACIIDKGFHLAGFSKSGTIEINMTFEAGFQEDDQTNPRRPYKGLKLKAFLPASGDGREALRLLKGAFAARKLFQIERNEYKGEDDVIVPNGITFKEAVDQFPDPEYLPNLIDQLKKLVE